MRTYKGFAGNSISLDSKKVVLTTQYVEEECAMGAIRDVVFKAPDFVRNGCLTVVTENNVVPIYFAQQHATRFIEAFSIVEALARENGRGERPLLGKDGRHLGRLQCRHAGHRLLRGPGRMDIYVLPGAFRFEYAMVDLGCTVPFKAVESLMLSDGEGGELLSLGADHGCRELSCDELSEILSRARCLTLLHHEGGADSLEFKGRRIKAVAPAMLDAFGLYLLSSPSEEEGGGQVSGPADAGLASAAEDKDRRKA